ncbi:MAG: phospholipase D-like domain-containing protein [Amylibacter sp.]
MAAKRRGVRVHMIMKQDYLKEKREPKAGKAGALDENRALLMEILRVGIDAKADYNPKIFHQKFIVRDGVSILTGSTNFTTTGVTKNLNHVTIIHDVKVAKEYKKNLHNCVREFSGHIRWLTDVSRLRIIMYHRYGSNRCSHPFIFPNWNF